MYVNFSIPFFFPSPNIFCSYEMKKYFNIPFIFHSCLLVEKVTSESSYPNDNYVECVYFALKNVINAVIVNISSQLDRM